MNPTRTTLLRFLYGIRQRCELQYYIISFLLQTWAGHGPIGLAEAPPVRGGGLKGKARSSWVGTTVGPQLATYKTTLRAACGLCPP